MGNFVFRKKKTPFRKVAANSGYRSPVMNKSHFLLSLMFQVNDEHDRVGFGDGLFLERKEHRARKHQFLCIVIADRSSWRLQAMVNVVVFLKGFDDAIFDEFGG